MLEFKCNVFGCVCVCAVFVLVMYSDARVVIERAFSSNVPFDHLEGCIFGSPKFTLAFVPKNQKQFMPAFSVLQTTTPGS